MDLTEDEERKKRDKEKSRVRETDAVKYSRTERAHWTLWSRNEKRGRGREREE